MTARKQKTSGSKVAGYVGVGVVATLAFIIALGVTVLVVTGLWKAIEWVVSL